MLEGNKALREKLGNIISFGNELIQSRIDTNHFAQTGIVR